MGEDNKDYFKGLFTGLLGGVVILFTVLLATNFKGNIFSGSSKNDAQFEKIFGEDADDKLKLINSYIENSYYEDVDKDQVLDGVYAGMMESLKDPYSEYYTTEEYKQLQDSTQGRYYGIGVQVTQNTETGNIKIIRVFDNSPAKEVGIQEGDEIYSVGGSEVAGLDLTTVVANIKGQEGTTIQISVKRDEQVLDFEVERRKLDVETVSCKMLDDHIGYLYISEFDGVTAQQTKEAIESLLSQGMTSIVVDLRDNPGGRLDSVTQILDMFLPKDKLLLYTETKDGEKQEYTSTTDGIIPDMPMTVIINGNSASASEVFTGAIKCYNRGKIVGTKSFGKGIVQSIYSLLDGSAVKVTIGKYYLPDDSNIHKVGIEPDYAVELPENVKSPWVLDKSEDPQLQKAIEQLK